MKNEEEANDAVDEKTAFSNFHGNSDGGRIGERLLFAINSSKEALFRKINANPLYWCLLVKRGPINRISIIHSLFIKDGELYGYGNIDGFGVSGANDPIILQINPTLLLERMAGIDKEYFADEPGEKSLPCIDDLIDVDNVLEYQEHLPPITDVFLESPNDFNYPANAQLVSRGLLGRLLCENPDLKEDTFGGNTTTWALFC